MIRIVSAFLLMLVFSACSEKVPPEPQEPPPPDTTSHDWSFTMYEVGGMNTTLRDVAVLSTDYALAVGKVESFVFPKINAYLWDGYSLKPVSLPMYPHDTITIDPQKNPVTSGGWLSLNAIWAFRRDNLWYSTDYGAVAHLTTRGQDTCVHQETWMSRVDFNPPPGNCIWARDTSELYFGGDEGKLLRFAKGQWSQIPVETGGESVDQLFGYSDGSLFVRSAHTLLRLVGGISSIIWNRSMPSLSDSVYFGAPDFYWATEASDSAWIGSLYVARIRRDGSGKATVMLVSQYRAIHGNHDNDVFIVGYDGLITHYNGASFKHFHDFSGMSIRLLAVKMTGNEVFIVGDRYFGGGIFIHGKRTH